MLGGTRNTEANPIFVAATRQHGGRSNSLAPRRAAEFAKECQRASALLVGGVLLHEARGGSVTRAQGEARGRPERPCLPGRRRRAWDARHGGHTSCEGSRHERVGASCRG